MSNSNPFGFSYLLDMFGCLPGTADNMELTYRFLETLVDQLGMTQMSAPVVIRAPRIQGVTQYTDKASVSGWVPLIESGIQIQSVEPTHFITLDVYSCRRFEPTMVFNLAQETFGFMDHTHFFTARGKQYGSRLDAGKSSA